jgi:N6-adenosine-specific RNA methylase IME4
MIDPPYNSTGLKLGYETMKNEQWMEVIKFSDLQTNGLVFFWVCNSSDDQVREYMTKQGYKRVETITWDKVTSDGNPANRGGYYCFHNDEKCLVFMKIDKRFHSPFCKTPSSSHFSSGL